METESERELRELRELVASQNNRLKLLEEGFQSTSETEGVHEQLRTLQTHRKRVYYVAGAVLTSAIGIALKLLIL